MSVVAPVDGFFVIMGNAFVNNDSGGSPQPYVLTPKVDGVVQTVPGWGGTFFMAPNGSAGERDQLDYTVTVPVTAGTHTVSQEIGPFSGTADFFWNNQHLTVMFIPGSRGQILSSPRGAPSGSSGMGG